MALLSQKKWDRGKTKAWIKKKYKGYIRSEADENLVPCAHIPWELTPLGHNMSQQ